MTHTGAIKAIDRRDGGQIRIIGIGGCKIESGCQIAANRAAPGRDVGLRDAESCFQEADHGGVIEDFGIDDAIRPTPSMLIGARCNFPPNCCAFVAVASTSSTWI